METLIFIRQKFVVLYETFKGILYVSREAVRNLRRKYCSLIVSKFEYRFTDSGRTYIEFRAIDGRLIYRC